MSALVVEMEARLCPARGQAVLRFTMPTASISPRDLQVSLKVFSNIGHSLIIKNTLFFDFMSITSVLQYQRFSSQ